jgi:hypothetical protein
MSNAKRKKKQMCTAMKTNKTREKNTMTFQRFEEHVDFIPMLYRRLFTW